MVTPMRRFALLLGLLLGATSACATEYGWGDLFLDVVANNAGTYPDQSGNGHNLSVPGASPPTFDASACNGHGGWVFDGSATSPLVGATGSLGASTFNFPQPAAEVTYVLVLDLNSSTPSSGNVPYMLLGGAWVQANGWGFASMARQIKFANSGSTASNTWAGALSTGALHLIMISMSQLSQQISVCVDACGSWTSFSLTPSLATSSPYDISLMLGGTGATSFNNQTPKPWWGHICEVMIFNDALDNSARAARFSAVQAYSHATYGVP